ncbi:MAG: ribose-phosphate pyrophosphokinase [Acidobacteria bacterium]|nr:MAG: ribose-phosphate pyrophosphokinase [Acidobacteriota bacterium]
MKDRLVFCTERYRYLRDRICAYDGFVPGGLDRRRFPDGERYMRVLDRTKGEDVFLVGGTICDSDTLELFDLACGLVYGGAISLTVIIPYFGYSTMERASNAGEVIPAKNRALLLSAIPKARMGNEFVFVDLHTDGVPHYFEGSIRQAQLSARSLVSDVLRESGENVILASTDAGRAKWVESLANSFGVEAAFVYKQRLSGEETRITGVNAKVEGRPIVIYDDMIRTGGSLIKAAETYLANGALSVAAFATHGVFPGSALDHLKASGCFSWIGITDTHPRVCDFDDPFLKVFSMAPVIVDYMRHEVE